MSDQADNGWAPPDPGPGAGGGGGGPEGGPGGAAERPPESAQPPEGTGQYPQPHPYPYGQPPPYPQVYGQPPQAYPQPQPYGTAQDPYGPYAQGYGYGPPVKRPWVVPLRPGAKYQHMARTDAHRWWRPLVGTLAILAGGLAATMVVGIVAAIIAVLATGEVPEDPGGSGTMLGDQIADLAFSLVALAVFLPFVLLIPWWIQRRRPGTLSSVAGRIRWRWLMVCAGIAVLYCGVSIGASVVAGMSTDEPLLPTEQWVGWNRFLLSLVVIVGLVPFQASAEEYFFRGWLLQGIGACTLEDRRGRVGRAFSVVFRTPWPAIAIGSALFVAGHGYTGWGMLDVFLFGVIAGWVTVRTGGLEAAIALHVLNNVMAFTFPAAVGELTMEQGAVDWQYVVVDVVSMLLFAVAVLWVARRMRVQTVVPGLEAVPSAPSGPPDPAFPVDPSGPVAGDPVAGGPGAPAVHAPEVPPSAHGHEAAER